jgi:hypothetical protein
MFSRHIVRLKKVVAMAQEERIHPSSRDTLPESLTAFVEQLGPVHCCLVSCFCSDPINKFLLGVGRSLLMSPAAWGNFVTAKFRALYCRVADFKGTCNGPI